MTGTIKLTVIDDDAASGKLLTQLDGKPLPTPMSASVVGNCTGPDKVAGKPDKGSHIYFMPDMPGARCDLSNGTQIKIKLDVDLSPTQEDVAIFPLRPTIPLLCIYDDPAKPNCDETYAKFKRVKNDHVVIYTLQNMDAKTKIPKYYKINFEMPVAGKLDWVTLDPKVINRPKFGEDVALALLCIAITGGGTFIARQLLARTNLLASRVNALSIAIGVLLGLVTAFALRGAIHF